MLLKYAMMKETLKQVHAMSH